jgi:hypothetical protein
MAERMACWLAQWPVARFLTEWPGWQSGQMTCKNGQLAS